MRNAGIWIACAVVAGLVAGAAACGGNSTSSNQASTNVLVEASTTATPTPNPTASALPSAEATISAETVNPSPPPVGITSVTYQKAPALPADLETRQRNAESEPNNWLLYGRTYKAWRYSPLDLINKGNIARLAPVWTMDTGMSNAFEASSIIVNGTMYFSTPWNNVLAVNAATGKVYWRYVHPLTSHPRLCCDAPNRGVGIGHDKVVMATLDAKIVALNAQTGKREWITTMADVNRGYSATLAPQVIGNKVVVGISGGEYGTRGFIDCYSIDNGKRIWRFYTQRKDTWQGDSWKTGGCPNWMTSSYDPGQNLIFCGIGNAAPDIDGSKRAGINLYATCVIALNLNTGKVKWYYQTVPHDVWDLDCTTSPMIDDLKINGKMRKVVMFSCKNGYFYVIDRTNGKPVYALQVANSVNWGTVSRDGTATPNKSSIPTEKGVVVSPGASGGKEWANEAYDPVRKLAFIPLTEEPFKHTVIKQPLLEGEFFWGGTSLQESAYGHIDCVDVRKGTIKWTVKTSLPQICSIACTKSGLVVTGTADRQLLVIDSETGKILKTIMGVSGWHGNPVVFGVKGKEYIAFGNGWGGPPQGQGTGRIAGQPTQNTMYVLGLK